MTKFNYTLIVPATEKEAEHTRPCNAAKADAYVSLHGIFTVRGYSNKDRVATAVTLNNGFIIQIYAWR